MSVELGLICFIVWLSLPLTITDVFAHRLPNALILPAYPLTAGALIGIAAVRDDWSPLVRASTAMSVSFVVFAFLATMGMGFGDAKLAGVLGLVLGWLGWTPLLVGMFLGFFYAAAAFMVVLCLRTACRRQRLPFGPFMFAGAITAALSDRWIGVASAVSFV